MQSNLICYYYSCGCSPDGEIVRLLYPLAFSLGVILTPLYYGLNHFVAEKIRLDGVWIKKGWVWIPLANHLEHAHALPLMLLDAARSAHAVTTDAEIYVVCGGYIGLYLSITLAAEAHPRVLGLPGVRRGRGQVWAGGLLAIAVPVVSIALGLGFVARSVGYVILERAQYFA